MANSRQLLSASGIPTHESARLLSVATALPTGLLRGGVELDEDAAALFEELVQRRMGGEPLQYLERETAFGPLTIAVDERVLIPRPETEYLLELTASLPAPRVVVDLCTGSGALALALKDRHPAARVIGVDMSVPALTVASSNGERLGLEVEWLGGNLFDPLPSGLRGSVELLVANPPYIGEAEWDDLPTDVRREPREALIGGATGTEVIEAILPEAPRWLSPGGTAWIEVGETQAEALASAHGWEVVADQYQRPRFLRLGT